jgi:hypothetical protein
MKSKQEYLVLLVILVVAAVLRFHHLGVTSLSNDELSSIIRAQYNSFSELYNEGIRPDVHPAGLQVFLYYWMKLAGDSPFAVRLPFAIAGVLSVFFVYLVARRWFNSVSALFTASAMAALQFPVLYSQVARMYSIGLLFCLINIWSWNKIVFPATQTEERKRTRYYIIYGLSALLAMYLHYFSLLFVAIVGLTGLLFIGRKKIVQYLIAWTAIVVLYLPAIPLFFEQLQLGGLEEWLAKPGSNTINRYLYYCFNESEILTTVILAIPVLGMLIVGRRLRLTRFQLITIAWFAIPYLVVFYYSVYRQPVLQYSGLLFSFPMLLLFIFSFLPDRRVTIPIAGITFVFLLGTTAVTVASSKFYSTPHFGVFKELAEKTVEWQQKYGEENITKVFTFSSPKYINYYFNKMNKNVDADLNLTLEQKEIGKLVQLLDTCKTEYLLYTWSNARHYYETLEIITGKYPVVAERDTFFNSEITLFKRGDINNSITFSVSDAFKEPTILTEPQKEFKGILYKNLSELNLKDDNMVTAEVEIIPQDSLQDVVLVINYESYGQNIGWKGMPVKYFYKGVSEPYRVILCSEIPDDRNSLLKIFIWNPSKRKLQIGNYKVEIKKKNPLYRII